MITGAFGPGRCIIATRIAVELAREAGMVATPLAVAVDLTSPGVSGRLGFEPPEMVPPGNWNGHLVCVLERRRLVDLTLDTANRPGLDPRPVSLEIDDEFLAGGVAESRQDEIEIRYEAHPDERGFLKLEDWNDKPERDRVLPGLRQALGGSAKHR